MSRGLPLIPLLVGLASIFLGYTYVQQQVNMAGTGEVKELNTPCALVHTPMYETKKTDVFTKGASHMALIHNGILRGFNSIYQQAQHIAPADHASFIGYSLAWFHFVKSHHDDEEENLFPMVEKIVAKPGVWDETHKEHESFLGGLANYAKYLEEVQGKPETFDGKKLVALMDGFKDDFENHFHSEIKTIAALSEMGEFAQAGDAFKKWGKSTLTKSGYTEGVPFLFLNFDRTFEDGMWKDWPPMPAVIRMAMVRIGSAWHWGWWKFASCDVNGQPKALYAQPSAK